MRFLKEIFERNKILAYTGAFLFSLAVILSLYATINTEKVLGINSIIKPIKFTLSTGIYAWTMAYLLFFVNNQKAVKLYSILAMVTMLYENGVISVQALRGTLSHFNVTSVVGGILYGLMGGMIVWLTTATLLITIRFIRQKSYALSASKVLSIKLGLILFVVFSFFGAYMSVVNSHSVGGDMIGPSLPFLNWSTAYGDLRVGHFFGMHALQMIPLFGFWISPKVSGSERIEKIYIWIFAIFYLGFVSFTIFQAINGRPFIAL